MTEMWERFTFYGMRALLVLFLVSQVTAGGFGLDDKKTATAIYGLYNRGCLLGRHCRRMDCGRLIGEQRAVMPAELRSPSAYAARDLTTPPWI